MANSRTKRHDVSLILYALKRKWGTPADFYKTSVGSPNFVSGSRSVSRVKYPISELITSRVTTARKFEYDIGYLAANKNFTYGGFYEPGDRLALVDGDDIFDAGSISHEDYFIINGDRYNPIKVIELDLMSGWLVQLRRIVGQKRYAIIDVSIFQRITIEEDIDVV